MVVAIQCSGCGVCVCHLVNHGKSILLTMLPWLHTYDIVLGEAVLQQAHPEELKSFQHT